MASIKKMEGKGGTTYKITVSMGQDYLGNQIRKYKTWKPDRPMTAKQAEKEAKRAAFEFEREIELGYQADNKQTFAEYAEYCYELRIQKGDKPQTLSRVKRMIDRINEDLGKMKLRDIRPIHLNKIYQKYAKPGACRWHMYYAPIVDIKEMIEKTGMTKKEFARQCGIDIQVIYRLCAGHNLTEKSARILENYLGRKDLFKPVGMKSPMSARTIKEYHAIIHTILKQAEKEMIVPYNAAARATLPVNRQARESKSLQPEQIKDILSALESEPIQFRTMINLFIVSGCRKGEILALKWEKIDFERNEIRIDRSAGYTPETGMFEGPTKTNNSRYISIPEQTMDLLWKYRAWQAQKQLNLGDMWQDNGLVFPNGNGNLIHSHSVNWQLNSFCEKYGFKHINPHMFRHTAASILLSNGVDVLTVSNMLGHSNTKTTLTTYAHEIEQARRKTAECISEILLNNKNA